MLRIYQEKLNLLSPLLIKGAEVKIILSRTLSAAEANCPFTKYKDRPLLEMVAGTPKSRAYIFWVARTISEVSKPVAERDYEYIKDRRWEFMAKFSSYKADIIFLIGVLRKALPEQSDDLGKDIRNVWRFFGSHDRWYQVLRAKIKQEPEEYINYYKNTDPINFYRNVIEEVLAHRRTLDSIKGRVKTSDEYAQEMIMRDKDFLAKSLEDLIEEYKNYRAEFERRLRKQVKETTLFDGF